MFQAGPTLPIPLQPFANGAGVPPMQGDLMIFGPGWLGNYWDGSGHVAIVRDVGPGYVDVVEQNATSSGTDRFSLNGSFVTANGYTPLIGWLRETEQAPAELTASSVAGTPQSVSDQPGDIDVIWRGTDAKLHDIAYRNEAWQTQSISAISPANAVSDPAVVSPSAGQVDAFWEDSSGDLWQAQSQSGLFGTETWLRAAGAPGRDARGRVGTGGREPGTRRDGDHLERDRRRALGQHVCRIVVWGHAAQLRACPGRS